MSRAPRLCGARQHRSTQRKVPRGRDHEDRLTADTIALARQYGRYGYRKIAGLLEQAGWPSDKRVETIWRRDGLRAPQTTQARQAVASGRIMHPAVSRAPQSRLVL